MRPDPKAEGLRGLRQAEHDLSDAEYSLAGRRYSLACFLCHQAASTTFRPGIPTAFPGGSPPRRSMRAMPAGPWGSQET